MMLFAESITACVVAMELARAWRATSQTLWRPSSVTLPARTPAGAAPTDGRAWRKAGCALPDAFDIICTAVFPWSGNTCINCLNLSLRLLTGWLFDRTLFLAIGIPAPSTSEIVRKAGRSKWENDRRSQSPDTHRRLWLWLAWMPRPRERRSHNLCPLQDMPLSAHGCTEPRLRAEVERSRP